MTTDAILAQTFLALSNKLLTLKTMVPTGLNVPSGVPTVLDLPPTDTLGGLVMVTIWTDQRA